MKKLKFATVFAYMNNIHIVKDPGMIPFTMQSKYGYSVAVPLSSLYDYPDAAVFFNNIETPFIDDKTEAALCFNRFKWIFRNASDIDILNLFHFDRWTFLDLWMYLKRNPKGLIYVHTDSDGERLRNFKFFKSPFICKILQNTLLTDKNLKRVLWGVQSKNAANELNGLWPFYNIEYIPDGVYWGDVPDVDYGLKKNIILTVARNGSEQKRTDILLEGWASVADEFPDWTLRLVGTVEDSFKNYLDRYFSEHPSLSDRTQFVGPIRDRKELAHEYAQAKIFTITSAWESFGIVTAEALSQACYVIGSDIPSTTELLDNGKYGGLFRSGNVDDFSARLREALSGAVDIKETSLIAAHYAKNQLSWDSILATVDKWIKENCHEI